MFRFTNLISIIAVVGLALTGCSKKENAAGSAKKAATKSAATAKTAKAAKKGATPAAAKGSEAKAAPAAKGPIAKVNGVSVARTEFDRKYNKMTRAFTKRGKEIPVGLAQRYKESILKQLVDKELLNQEIKKKNVTIENTQLDKEFAEYKKMFRTDDNFNRYLKSSDISVNDIKNNIRHNLAVKSLLKKQGDLNVPEEETKKYYDTNLKRYAIKEQVRASHILIKVSKKDDAAKQAASEKKAQTVHGLASAKGADFAKLAKEHSEGPTKTRGGDLSFFTKGRMVPEFEKVAFGMKPDAKGKWTNVSKPIRTQFGWHIIKVTDKKEGRQRKFDEVKESIGKLLQNKKSRRAKADLLRKLKSTGKIETFLPKAKKTALKAPGISTKRLPSNLIKVAPKAKLLPKKAGKVAAPAGGKK